MMLYRADDNTVSEQTSGNWYDEAVDWAKENQSSPTTTVGLLTQMPI